MLKGHVGRGRPSWRRRMRTTAIIDDRLTSIAHTSQIHRSVARRDQRSVVVCVRAEPSCVQVRFEQVRFDSRLVALLLVLVTLISFV